MADRRKRFTEQKLERLRPPKRGRLELTDAVAPGLVLRVTERGTKTFSASTRSEIALRKHVLPRWGESS